MRGCVGGGGGVGECRGCVDSDVFNHFLISSMEMGKREFLCNAELILAAHMCNKQNEPRAREREREGGRGRGRQRERGSERAREGGDSETT